MTSERREQKIIARWGPEDEPRGPAALAEDVAATMEVVGGLVARDLVWVDSDLRPAGQGEDLLQAVPAWKRGGRNQEYSAVVNGSLPGTERDPMYRGVVVTLSLRVGGIAPRSTNVVKVQVDRMPVVSAGEVEAGVLSLAGIWGAREVMWMEGSHTDIAIDLGLPVKSPLPGWVTWVRDGVVDPFVGGREVGGGRLHRFAESPEGVTREVVAARLAGGAGA